MHTHYDNLKVSHNAPPEVIRAAYKVLSQKYHPDRNNGDDEAERIMTIINQSYEVLSNPRARKAYDNYLKGESFRSNDLQSQTQTSHNQSSLPPRATAWTKITANLLAFWWIYLMGGIYIYEEYIKDKNAVAPQKTAPAPSYVRPLFAPNGQSWPVQAGNIPGYKRSHTNGLSQVTIDNSNHDSDVFVKLFSLDYDTPTAVRYVYIPAGSKFNMTSIRPGGYDVRYQNLDTGSFSQTQSFQLEEVRDETGTRYSTISMTIYKVRNGNMKTTPISGADFE